MSVLRRRPFDVAMASALLLMPFWMTAIGGYTELATRILVMGLAAMSLNFLLGFTGVLSFGHAAYFGLGAYGVAMGIRYLGLGTIPAMGLGILAGLVAAAIIGALIVRRRASISPWSRSRSGKSSISSPSAGTRSPEATTV